MSAAALLELQGVSKRFVKTLDLAGRIAPRSARRLCTPWTGST